MEETRNICCSIKGKGKISGKYGQAYDFNLVDLCTEGARIHTLVELEAGIKIKVNIVLDAVLFEVQINTNAEIVQKSGTQHGYLYELEFIGLPEKDRREIDDIVRSNCGVF